MSTDGSLLRAFLLLLLVPALGGCYLLQAAEGQLEVLNRRQSIAGLIEAESTQSALRERLRYVAAVREYASTSLGLPDNRSYRDYADLGRRFVVWNVFATPRLSVTPRRWCFPIAGCVVYRGYFAERAARRYARRLAGRDYDVMVSGVTAYSTLGHFADPVLSGMLDWSDAQLAGTLFHELAHQVVYAPGDSAFNEAFATVVEEEGLMRWLRASGEQAELVAWQAQRDRGAAFTALLLETRASLDALYGGPLPDVEKAYRKQQAFGLFKFRLEQLRERWRAAGVEANEYDGWLARGLNNAYLVPVATYRSCVPGLRRLLGEAGGDLRIFYVRVAALAERPVAERSREVCEGSGEPLPARP